MDETVTPPGETKVVARESIIVTMTTHLTLKERLKVLLGRVVVSQALCHMAATVDPQGALQISCVKSEMRSYIALGGPNNAPLTQ